MVTLLRDILPFDLFKRMLDEGYIRSQVHPLYPDLLIFNYTQEAQFDRVWNAATNVCRGLIVIVGLEGLNENAVVLARPFNKFHNLNTDYVPETHEANLPTDAPPLVTEKLDGSMGVLYRYGNELWIATRGSFDSEQARWATQWMRDHEVKHGYSVWLDGYTPVFEIIYSTNRIVVDYDFEELVLLSLVNIATGSEMDRVLVESMAIFNHVNMVEKFNKSLAECAAENNLNEEGYVLTYSNGVKVKVKFAEYVRLHRVLTGLNPRAIWEMLSQGSGEAVDAILNDPKMPVAFLEWFRGWVEQLRGKFAALENESKAVFYNTPHYGESVGDMTKEERAQARKANALYYKQTPHLMSILFAMLDGKDYVSIIWDRIEPKGNATFKKDGE